MSYKVREDTISREDIPIYNSWVHMPNKTFRISFYKTFDKELLEFRIHEYPNHIEKLIYTYVIHRIDISLEGLVIEYISRYLTKLTIWDLTIIVFSEDVNLCSWYGQC